MRVTNQMLSQSMLSNIQGNLNKLQEYENQYSSGVKVNQASDDPVAAAKIYRAKSELNSQTQYSTNLSYADSYLDTVSDALSSVYDILDSARQTALSGSNGTNSEGSLTALGDSINGLIESLVQVANTNYNGSYVFGGGRTSSEPFSLTTGASGDVTQVQFISSSYDEATLDQTYSQKIEIASGVTIDLAAGKTTFHTDGSGNVSLNAVFNTLIKLRDNLNNGDTGAVSSSLTELDGYIDNITSEEAVVGAKINRIEAARDRATTYTTTLKTLISDLQDIDITEVSTKYGSAYTTYEASLNVAASIMQKSLLDFLD